MEELEIGFTGAVWFDRWTSRGLVHGSVLCALFHDASLEGGTHNGELVGRRFFADWNAFLHRFWIFVRQDRKKAHHHAGSLVGGGDVFPRFPSLDQSGQP